MVLGFCIGGPFTWSLLQRAPERVVAAVLAQPSGFHPEMPNLFYNNMACVLTSGSSRLIVTW